MQWLDNVDDLYQSLRRRVHHSPIENVDIFSNGTAKPHPKLYNPHQDSGNFLERFASGLGIGWSEGSKESLARRKVDGSLAPGGTRNIEGEVGYMGYSRPFWGDIYDMANNVANEAAWFLGKRPKNTDIALNHQGKSYLKSLDTVYVPYRRDNFKSDLGKVVQDIEPEFASALGVHMGRLGADIAGHGTRKYFWNMNPEDFIGTFAGKILGSDLFLEDLGLEHSNTLSNAIRFGSAVGLGIGSGNWNPLNVTQGGRPTGFEAVSEDPNDPRQSTQPLVDLIVSRGLLGRTGTILPWEQFNQERPDVSYADYEAYKNYLYNRDPGLINRMTLGLVKGTPDGIDGESPEARILGYRVTPEGIVGAGLGAAIPIAIAKEIKDGTLTNALSSAIRAIR